MGDLWLLLLSLCIDCLLCFALGLLGCLLVVVTWFGCITLGFVRVFQLRLFCGFDRYVVCVIALCLSFVDLGLCFVRVAYLLVFRFLYLVLVCYFVDCVGYLVLCLVFDFFWVVDVALRFYCFDWNWFYCFVLDWGVVLDYILLKVVCLVA